MSTSSGRRDAYHHGDLRNALVEAAQQMLEAHGETGVSLREVARTAGVSSAAPYRHFADKDALLAAVATRGYQELELIFEPGGADPTHEAVPVVDLTVVDLVERYVAFALAAPARFRLMVGHPCTRDDAEASAAAHRAFGTFSDRFPSDDPDVRTGAWAFAHGLATLLIDGTLCTVDEWRTVVRTVTERTLGVR